MHNPKISEVVFEEFKTKFGVAFKDPVSGEYTISLDESKLPCPFMMLFVFYHELGHVVLYHLGYRKWKMSDEDREKEADLWAYREIGIFDDNGQVKKDFIVCMRCMDRRSLQCLKESVTLQENEHRESGLDTYYYGFLNSSLLKTA